MRWNVIFAAMLTVGLCNSGYGFEFLNRMLGTSSHYSGCNEGCCGTPSCSSGCGCNYDDALSAKYGCPPPCPCDCSPKPRSYTCIKICIPKITLPCPKIFCSNECYKPEYLGCGCGSSNKCHGYHYEGHGGYGPGGYGPGGYGPGGYGPAYGAGYPASPIPSNVDPLPEPVNPPIVEPSAYHAPRTASRPEALWNW